MTRGSWKLILRIVAIIAFIAIAFYFARLVRESDIVRSTVNQYGYIGVFAIAVVSGFNLVVPIPAIAFLPVMLEAGLNFWTSMVMIVIGVTLADSTAFFIGRTVKKLKGPTNNRIVQEFKKAERKNSLAPLFGLFFFVSFVPLPSEIVLIPMGYMEYKFIQILPVIFVGNMVFNFLVANGILGLFYGLT